MAMFETESKMEEEVIPKAVADSETDPSYNCFNFWKVPVISSDHLNLHNL